MDSVQKSSEIRNFCTEFLLFAYLAKKIQNYLLLYFLRRYWRFKYKKIRRNLQGTFTLAFYSR